MYKAQRNLHFPLETIENLLTFVLNEVFVTIILFVILVILSVHGPARFAEKNTDSQKILQCIRHVQDKV